MRTSPHLAVALGVIALAGATLGMGATASVAVAASACQASYLVLGQTPAATGATPTDWFIVFGDNFDPSVPATLTFSASVIPWSVEQPMSVRAPVTSFTMRAEYMASGFKWTFRAQDGKVKEIAVRITGKACEARTVVDLSPPVTATTQERTGLSRSVSGLAAHPVGLGRRGPRHALAAPLGAEPAPATVPARTHQLTGTKRPA